MSDQQQDEMRKEMVLLTIELKQHRTHAHGFMQAQDLLNNRVLQMLDGQAKHLQELKIDQALTKQRVEQLEKQVAAINPKLDEMSNSLVEMSRTIAWWVGGGVCTITVVGAGFQLLPLVMAWVQK